VLYKCADEAAHRLKLNAEFAASLGELAECMARQRCDAFSSSDCIFIYNKQVEELMAAPIMAAPITPMYVKWRVVKLSNTTLAVASSAGDIAPAR